jgi:hypothetical protein
MEVVTLLLFIGALWGLAAIGLFAWNLLGSNPDHAERLALLPIEDNWRDPMACSRSTAKASEP